MDLALIGSYIIGLIILNKRIYHNPIVGFWFWMIYLLIEDILNIAPIVNIGLNIHLHDIVFTYFTIVGILRYRNYSFYAKNDAHLRVFLFSLLFLVLSLPIFVIFANQPFIKAFNFSRKFIIFAPAFVYFFSFKYSEKDLKKIARILFLVSGCSAIIVFFLLITSNSGERIISSYGTLFLAYASLIMLAKYYQESTVNYLVIALFLILMVLLLRHRSVWIMLTIGLIYLHFYVKINTNFLGLLLIILLAMVYIPLLFPEKFDNLSKSIIESSSPFRSSHDFDNSTGGGRVERWKYQIENRLDWKMLLWGKGHGYNRNVYLYNSNGELSMNDASFHNHYLEQLFRIGGISVLILLLFMLKFFRLNHYLQKFEKDYLLLGFSACLFGTLGYGMTYNFSFFTFIIAGIGYSILIKDNEDY